MNEDFEDAFNYFMSGFGGCVFPSKPVFVWDMKKELDKEYMRRKPDGFKCSNGKMKSIDKIIFENKYCVIIDNFGNKYIAKPEKGERFDKEKGFLVALAKYNGFTTTKCQELIKKAVDKDDKKAKKQNKSNGNKKQTKKN